MSVAEAMAQEDFIKVGSLTRRLTVMTNGFVAIMI